MDAIWTPGGLGEVSCPHFRDTFISYLGPIKVSLTQRCPHITGVFPNTVTCTGKGRPLTLTGETSLPPTAAPEPASPQRREDCSHPPSRQQRRGFPHPRHQGHPAAEHREQSDAHDSSCVCLPSLVGMSAAQHSLKRRRIIDIRGLH